MNRSDVKLLLIQTRRDAMREQEQRCFVTSTGLASEQIVPFDLWGERPLDESVLVGIDGVIIGGSGDAVITEPDTMPWLEGLSSFARLCVERDVPTFGACFGFQVLVHAFGGKIESVHYELDSVDMERTAASYGDPVFDCIPDEFVAVSAHNDSATAYPEGFVNFAKSDQCPLHAFKIEGKPVYATLFHPDLDRETLRERLDFYREHWIDNADEIQAVYDNVREVPDAPRLLAAFVDHVVLPAQKD